MTTVFLRVLEAEDKATALLSAVHGAEGVRGQQRFDVDPASFASVPRSPFAYWVSDRVRRIFKELPPFECDVRTARGGAMTLSDARFLRAWWEVSADRIARAWIPFNKGGVSSPFYLDIHLVIDWEDDARRARAFYERHTADQQWGGFSRGEKYYYRPGVTWPLRASRFAPQVMPAACIFSVRGFAAFVDLDHLLSTLAVFSSSTFDFLFKLMLGRFSHPEFIIGSIQQMPWPEFSASDQRELSELARRAWSLKRSLDTRTEASHEFTLPALLQSGRSSMVDRSAAWVKRVTEAETELANIQAEIDARCFLLYGIDEADRRVITEGFGGRDSGTTTTEVMSQAEEGDHDADDANAEATTDAASLAADLASWSVGVALGRFDVRLATGVRPMPPEPQPFEALPTGSPGMLTGADGLPIGSPPAGYPLGFPALGVLVDDPGHAQDLTAAMRVVFEVVFGADADHWWREIAALLHSNGSELNVWFATSFFEHHLKHYSKSRRNAPILWQLATPTARYSVWIYAHRLTRDTFFQLQNDIVGPKLAHEERKLTSLLANTSPSAAERKDLAAQETLVDELRAMLDEVKRVAPLWNPNLDDGVVLTMAPLWRLVPQHKSWQKELRSKWEELTAGKYDWAHVAMHLWPERVVPKCATDRSLAIAHGLEEIFWIEGSDGKWKARAKPQTPISDLVRERTSPAVKAALKSLLDAPGGHTSRSSSRSKGAR